MKKWVLLTLILCIFGQKKAYANNDLWQGIQSKVAVHAQMGNVRATLASLIGSKKEVNAQFLYLGGHFKLGEYFWISPHIGLSNGFLGKEWALVSIWSGFRKNWFSLFFEIDFYTRFNHEFSFYSYLSIDASVGLHLSFGIHIEGVNEAFTIGPHIDWHIMKFKKMMPKLTLSLQSFTSVVNAETMIRLVCQLEF